MTEPIAPMKAQLSSVEFLAQVSNDDQWAAGEKFDGYREVLYLGKEHNEMLSSLGTSHIANTPQFHTIIPELAGTVVDCEGMAPTRLLEDNASCFKAHPANAIAWQERYGQATLVAFDVLQFMGEDTISLPFEARISLLRTVVAILRQCGMPVVQEKLVIEGKLEYYQSIVARTQAEGHEGVILKHLRAPYEPGKRSPNWLKVKRFEQLEYQIRGFTPGCGKYDGLIGSIVYGDSTRDIGTASGMSDLERVHMTESPEQYIGKPALFECQEVTRYGVMRHPRYKGLV